MSTTGNRGMLKSPMNRLEYKTTYQANWDKKYHKCSTKICYSRYITKTNCGHGNLVIKLHNEIMNHNYELY